MGRECGYCRRYRIMLMGFALARIVVDNYQVWLSVKTLSRPFKLPKKSNILYTVYRTIEMFCTYYALPYEITMGIMLFCTVYRPFISTMYFYTQLELELILINIAQLCADYLAHLSLTVADPDEVFTNDGYNFHATVTRILMRIGTYHAIFLYSAYIQIRDKQFEKIKEKLNSIRIE